MNTHLRSKKDSFRSYEQALQNIWGATKSFMEVKMRLISLALAGSVLASCTAVPPQPTRTAKAQQRYEMLLAGKVARAPISCLPTYRADDMIRIDDDTVIFRDGSRRVYVNHMHGPCDGLANETNTLVTREYTSPGPCSGDIARVVDMMSHMTVGSCAWGEFVPYEGRGA